MTAARRRFLICLALALAAHAALFAAMIGHNPLPDDVTQPTLRVTFNTQATAADVATSVLAAQAQHGPDEQSRHAQTPATALADDRSAAVDGPPTATARIQRRSAAATQRPTSENPIARKHTEQRLELSARTRRARSDPRAAYLTAWRQRVEAYGNQHYPAALLATTRRHRLTLGVTLSAAGHLHSVRILRSSGSAELDRAAVAIVRDAAPYAALPAALRTHNRQLTFAYDWVFDDTGRD